MDSVENVRPLVGHDAAGDAEANGRMDVELAQGLERLLGVPLRLVEEPEELGDGELLKEPDVHLVSQLARAVLQAAGATLRDVSALTIYVVNYRAADLETPIGAFLRLETPGHAT